MSTRLVSAWGSSKPLLLGQADLGDALFDSNLLLAAAKRGSSHHVKLSIEAPQLWLMFWADNQMMPLTLQDSTVLETDGDFSSYLERLSDLLETASCLVQVTSLAQFGGFPLWQALSKLLEPIIETNGPLKESKLSLFAGMDASIASIFLADRFSDPKASQATEPHSLIVVVQGACIVAVDGGEHSLGSGDALYVPAGAKRSVRLEGRCVLLCLAVSSSPSEVDDGVLVTKAATSFGRNLVDDKVEHEIVRIDQPVTGPPKSFAEAMGAASTFSSRLLDLVSQEWLKERVAMGFESPPPRDNTRSLEDCEFVKTTGGVPIRWCSTPTILLLGLGGRVMQIESDPTLERAIRELNEGKPVEVQALVESASEEDLEEVVYDFLQNLLSFHAIEEAAT